MLQMHPCSSVQLSVLAYAFSRHMQLKQNFVISLNSGPNKVAGL